MISAPLTTVEKPSSGKRNAQRPNCPELNTNHRFSNYYVFKVGCCMLKKAKLYFPHPKTEQSDFPHHSVAAACIYLCACMQQVYNLSIYVCVSVFKSTAQDALRLSAFQSPVHTHTPLPTTNYKGNLIFGKGPRFTESSFSMGMPDHVQQAQQKYL